MEGKQEGVGGGKEGHINNCVAVANNFYLLFGG